MDSAIRFQSIPGPDQKFLYVNVTDKSFRLCRITGKSEGVIEYDTISTHSRMPPFRAFDWSPTLESLVVVGQSSGEASLLRIDDNSQDSLSFRVRNERLCNTVALSAEHLLAAGLDKVRTDFCLNIWDIQQRLPSAAGRGFNIPKVNSDPLHKLASSEPISSLRFFRDDPKTLVAGVKGQFVRLYDLREPHSSHALQFATRCVHNLAIDGKDENYIASCYPTNDPEICIWDRRMAHRSGSTFSSFSNSGQGDSRQAEVSLELKNAIDIPGQIWSLRFSKTRRGCLGVLSNTGHFKIYDISKDFSSDPDGDNQSLRERSIFAEEQPQKVLLERTQDIERVFSHPSKGREETSRIVSFDFMLSETFPGQPDVIALTGDGRIKMVSPQPSPEPASFSSLNFFCRGRKEITLSVSDQIKESENDFDVGAAVHQIRRQAEPHNSLKLAFKNSKQSKSRLDPNRMASFANQSWNADLGFFERGVSLPKLLTLSSAARLRCQKGYLFNPAINIAMTSDSRWLQAYWQWIERAAKISRSGGMTQDNLDLSYLGVFGLWMEDVSYRTRSIGPSSNKISKILDNLSRRLNVPAGACCETEYPANRLLCLYSLGLAWTHNDLETMVKRYMAQNRHAKAAAVAIFSDDRKLAYRALRQGSRGPSGQNLKMLAMAIAGAAARKSRSKEKETDGASEAESETDRDTDWTETIGSLAEELADPYARAILAWVRTGNWASMIEEESLPLKYRVMVALKWLSDSNLTTYIGKLTKEAIAAGDIEGIILTGTGTNEAIELMRNCIARFGDLQTAVLGLAVGGAAMRFVDDLTLLRRYESWREAYRHNINSWGLKFDRVRFDIGFQKLAVDHNGRKLLPRPKPQVGLVCGYCTGALGQLDGRGANDGHGSEIEVGVGGPDPGNSGQKSVLTRERAAAVGTVCPKCGRNLPRCGVCDLWLGVPDPSFMRWYGTQNQITDGGGSGVVANGAVDLSASVRSSASVGTTIGPPTFSLTVPPLPTSSATTIPRTSSSSNIPSNNKLTYSKSHVSTARANSGTSPTRKASQDIMNSKSFDRDELVRRFTVFCVKCAHGFHAGHARDWFSGYNGRPGHRVCPVSDCGCSCGL